MSVVRATHVERDGIASGRKLSRPNQRGRSGAGASGLGEMTSRNSASPSRKSKLCVPIRGCSPPIWGSAPRVCHINSAPASSDGDVTVMWSNWQRGTLRPLDVWLRWGLKPPASGAVFPAASPEPTVLQRVFIHYTDSGRTDPLEPLRGGARLLLCRRWYSSFSRFQPIAAAGLKSGVIRHRAISWLLFFPLHRRGQG